MQAKVMISYIGRTLEPSKGKSSFHYLFVNGTKSANGFDNPTPIDFWSPKLFKLKYEQAYEAILDVQGDFVSFVDFVTPVEIVELKK